MVHLKNAAILAASLLALVGCAKSTPPAADAAADEAAIRAVNPGWFKAYNAGEVAAIIDPTTAESNELAAAGRS